MILFLPWLGVLNVSKFMFYEKVKQSPPIKVELYLKYYRRAEYP